MFKDLTKEKKNELVKKNARYLKELRARATPVEVILGKYLIEKNVYFVFQKGFVVPFHRIVDFYLPKRKTIIEVDGGYHKDIVEKDMNKDFRWLLERNKKTVRITNEEVYNGVFKFKLDPFILPVRKYDGKKKSKYPVEWDK